jgi:predicted nucleic acid-binding protein
MTAVLDTNVLVRHLIGEPPDQARRATARLRHEEELLLLSPVLAEVVFVMESIYEQPRDVIAIAALSLLALPAIVAPEGRVLVDALLTYQMTRTHFVDSYIAAVARRSGIQRVVSFDRGFDRVEP